MWKSSEMKLVWQNCVTVRDGSYETTPLQTFWLSFVPFLKNGYTMCSVNLSPVLRIRESLQNSSIADIWSANGM